MPNQRVKGMETTVFMTQNGVTLAQLDSIREFEMTVKFKLLEEQYLGETTVRYDEIFEGFDGGFECHLTTATTYDILQAIIDRARRRVPGTKFNVKTTLQFPDGERKRVIIDNLFFGPLPNTIPSRDSYATLKFSFSAASGRFL